MKKRKLLALVLGWAPQLVLAGSAIVSCTGIGWSNCMTYTPDNAYPYDLQPPIQCSGVNCQGVHDGGCIDPYHLWTYDCLVRSFTVHYNYCGAYNSQGCPISLNAPSNSQQGYYNAKPCGFGG